MFEKNKLWKDWTLLNWKGWFFMKQGFLRENVLYHETNKTGIYSVIPTDFLLASNGRLTWSSASGPNCSTGWTPSCLITWLMISAIRVIHSEVCGAST